MRKIDIAINQATLLSYSVYLDEGDLPRVCAKIGLFSGEKKISEFSIDTNAWDSKQKFELPPQMISPIMKIAKELEHITALRCSAAIGQLTDGKS